MPVTSPDSIFYADGSTPMSTEAISAAEATSVQEALTNSRAIRSYRWPTSIGRGAQAGMAAGDIGYQEDTSDSYVYNGVKWLNDRMPFVIVGLSTALTTAAATIPWGTQILNPDGMWVLAQPTRLTIPESGIYEISAKMLQSGTSASTIFVEKNGVTGQLLHGSATGATGASASPGLYGYIILNQGDYIEAKISSAASTAWTINTPSQFSAHMISRL